MGMSKGDIVLIPFPFTDLSGNKLRPAVVLFTVESDVTVAFITSKMKFSGNYDLKIKKSTENALKVDSVLKVSKIATIDKGLVIGMLGILNVQEISEMNAKLNELFALK